MNTLQQGEYISIQQGCQQLKLEICGGREYKAEKDEFYRQVSAQLEELDYRELYSAYSEMIRKSQVEAMSRRSGFSAISGTAIPRPTRTRPLCT